MEGGGGMIGGLINPRAGYWPPGWDWAVMLAAFALIYFVLR